MITNNNRPTSPHLQIYRLPLTAILSITHRATGVLLALGAVIMVWVLAEAANGVNGYNQVMLYLDSWYGQLFLLGLTFSLYLHFCNGLRHLFWDVGLGFELETVAKTAKLAIIAATVLTIATWLVAFTAG